MPRGRAVVRAQVGHVLPQRRTAHELHQLSRQPGRAARKNAATAAATTNHRLRKRKGRRRQRIFLLLPDSQLPSPSSVMHASLLRNRSGYSAPFRTFNQSLRGRRVQSACRYTLLDGQQWWICASLPALRIALSTTPSRDGLWGSTPTFFRPPPSFWLPTSAGLVHSLWATVSKSYFSMRRCVWRRKNSTVGGSSTTSRQ